MLFSYSSYKNDIDSFSTEEYIQNLENSISYNFFVNFIENYKEIENEDLKKPIFTQTNKFKKVPNTYKNYKCLKINNEQKNVWSFEKPTNENDKIYILIKTYLNKISQDTYKKISQDFLLELNEIDNNNLFDILSSEILNKCLFDNKYRNLYINLCYKIWNNKQIHYNQVNIISNDNNNYYWSTKSNNLELNGPFTTENNAKNDIYQKIFFKKYFLNYIQNLYKNRDMNFENLSEEETFIKKKKVLLIIELIGILFLEKYINFDIINLLIIDILKIDNNFLDKKEIIDTEIKEIEIEGLYIIIKLINDAKQFNYNFIDYKNIFNEYINIIELIITNKNISKRCIFFLNDVILMLNNFNNFNNLNNKKINKNNSYNSLNLTNETNDINKINKLNKEIDVENENLNNKNLFVNNIKNNNSKIMIELYNKINNKDFINELINKSIDTLLNNKNTENILLFFKNINKEYIFENIQKIVENINDIILDIPDANKKLLLLITEINFDNEKKNQLINILENINNDSSEDSEDSSEDNEDSSEDSEDSSEDSEDSSDSKIGNILKNESLIKKTSILTL